MFIKGYSSSQPTLIYLRPLAVFTLGREKDKVTFSLKSEYSGLPAVKVNNGLLLLNPLHKHLNVQQHTNSHQLLTPEVSFPSFPAGYCSFVGSVLSIGIADIHWLLSPTPTFFLVIGTHFSFRMLLFAILWECCKWQYFCLMPPVWLRLDCVIQACTI